MSFTIAGIGTSVPEHRIGQSDAARLALTLYNDDQDRKRLLPVLYRRAGVRYRHSVLLESSDGNETAWQTFYRPAQHATDRGPTTRQRMERYDVEAGPLAARAAQGALDDAGVPPDEITHLVTASCTGFAAPGVDMSLIQTLGLGPDVARTHVGFMGCHGALNAIRVAGGFTSASPRARVLVCAVELCSLHQQYEWTPDNVVANALFGDGAGAVVGCGESVPVKGRSLLTVLASGSVRLDDCSDFMTWKIGDHGFTMTLSAQVPDVLRERLSGWLSGWLRCKGWTLDQIQTWAIHPGGPRILSACADVLGLGDDDMAPSRSVLEDFGNMSSPTVLFIVERLRKSGAPLPWLLLGFGPGLAIEAVLVGAGADTA
jgi:predicted naringenin-chalcone synthase